MTDRLNNQKAILAPISEKDHEEVFQIRRRVSEARALAASARTDANAHPDLGDAEDELTSAIAHLDIASHYITAEMENEE